MTDVALAWNPELSAADMALTSGALLGDDGLRTAILISLFSNARAPAGADLPERGDDRQGWWGDEFAAANTATSGPASEADALGSTLWLLRRAKLLPAVVEQARAAAAAALGWLVRDGVASSVTVLAQARGADSGAGLLALGVVLDRPAGPGRQRFDYTWDASTGDVSSAEGATL